MTIAQIIHLVLLFLIAGEIDCVVKAIHELIKTLKDLKKDK